MRDICFAIVTWNQPSQLKRLFDSIMTTTPGIEASDIIIVSNHTNFVSPGLARIFQNSLRPDDSIGFLSRSWNQCLQFGFGSSIDPHYRWVCLVQSDNVFLDGWYDRFQSAIADRNLELIACGPGDQAVFTSIDAFRQIGWWDERFCGIGYHEFDYFIRAYLRLGKRVSIEGHGSQLVWNWQALDLIKRNFEEHSGHLTHNGPLVRHLYNKWGRETIWFCFENAPGVDDRGLPSTVDGWTKVLDVNYGTEEARYQGHFLKPMPIEYNWYPHFYRKDPNDYTGIYPYYAKLL